MPRSGSGTYTLPSGNPVVTGTTIESNWANTTLSDIATTLSDSLSRSGQGGMTAALRVADGTQGAPGVGFANETGSGFYRAGTGEVWAVVQGAQTLNLDANGVYVPADKTTTVDGAFVHNEAGADKDARFEGDTDVNLLFTDASTDRVGIGTNTPSTKLHVVGDVTVSGAVNAATVNATTLDLTNLEVTNIKAKDGTAAATITDSTGVVNFAADVGVGASTPTFGSGSGVEIERAGIATLRLENSSASNSFELYADSAANGINLRGRDSSPMNFWTANTLQMKLDSSGNLGLGVTPAANQRLDVTQPANSNASACLQARSNVTGAGDGTTTVLVSRAVNSTGGNWAVGKQDAYSHVWGVGTTANTSSAMTLDASGNLGVGTTSPQRQIETYVAAGGNALQARSSAVTIDAGINSSNDGGFLYTRTNHFLAFGTNNAERARITSGGDLLVGTTSNSLSGASRTFALVSPGFAAAFQTTSSTATDEVLCLQQSATTGDNTFIVFKTDGGSGTLRGTITYNRAGGLTAYNTTSDYRAKDIIGPVQNPGATIDALKVYEGVMKGATQSRPMLIAHEAQAHAPYAVSGVKDEVNEDGTPKFQQMDVSSLVPLLLAEIQSLRARVAALEAQP